MDERPNLDLSEDLSSLDALRHLDVPGALNKIRYITEKVLYARCLAKCVSWGQGEPTLERMLGPLVAAEDIPKNIAIYVRSIQGYTSPGSHFQSVPLSADHVDLAFGALERFLQWANGGTAAAAPIAGAASSRSSRKSDLRLVDARIIARPADIASFRASLAGSHHPRPKRDHDSFPIMDIKLRNVGGTPVFLKRLRFEDVRNRRWVQREHGRADLVTVSWEYSVFFDLDTTECSLDVAQGLEPHAVDRFCVVIAAPNGDWTFHVHLDFNEEETLSLGLQRMRVNLPGFLFGRDRQVPLHRLPPDFSFKPRRWWRFW